VAEPEPVLEVTAAGRAQAVPDQVVVGLGVEVRDASVGAAVSRASGAVDLLLGVLDAAGVTGEDRQTTGLSVQESYGPQGPDGFLAAYRLTVVVRDLAAAGALVQTAADAVGEPLRVSGFALGVQDVEPVEARARAAAVRAARRQAEQLAAAAGAWLGRLLELREDGGGPQVVAHRMASGGRSSFPVEPGAIDSTVVVTARWQLLQPPD
jgi:uncharacterized protein YggE